MSGHEDAERSRRNYNAPYTQKHPIPTIARYREEKENRKGEALYAGDEEDGEQKQTRHHKDQQKPGAHEPDERVGGDDAPADDDEAVDDEATADTSEVQPTDFKERRKGLKKKNGEERAERVVTDPITHLPVNIYDFTTESLKEIDENPPPFGSTSRTATRLSNKNKTTKQLTTEQKEMHDGLESMNALFPPPSFDEIKKELVRLNKLGVTAGLLGTVAIVLLALGLEHIFSPVRLARWTSTDQHATWYFYTPGIWAVLGLLSVAAMWALVAGVRIWTANRIDDVWEEQVWEANLEAKEREAKTHETETVAWLNSLLGSIWPLINPDLFTSLADTLEDVMQASLPGLVQMVSVEDIGQGSEALRILGIRCLPSGAAARSVGSDGKLQSKQKNQQESDRAVPVEGKVDPNAKSIGDDHVDSDGQPDDKDKDNGDGTEKADVADGLEAEEGDFINLEIAFAYRARASKSFQDRTKDIHLYLAFYLPGNIKIPVWVDFKGIVGTCRLRLQLAPDPPFFALGTLTFLGQPKVDIGCIPLIKRGPNIMDLPLISSFVQSSVDAAMAEYVAPKSLTLDLKDMLAGDDFKKDTVARGIVVIDIMHGYHFKMGDAQIPLISDGGSDPYVSVGWAKFGKPMFSTRVLIKEMEPFWHERCYLLVTPEELNVDERLRVQLWDSDRFTADDDLGRIEVDLKSIMRSEETNGRMNYRTDDFKALKAGETMPGKLEWRIGYFSKTRLQACQYERQTYDTSIRSHNQLEEKIDDICMRKLREAMIKNGRHSRTDDELKQQKQQEKKMMEDAIIISAPPPDDYPTGIFSIVLHQITGLELERQSKSEVEKSIHHEDDEETSDNAPSAYCTVIINHKKVFRTRTKPKNAKPFYNAGTERFIGDWRNAEVYVSVRDARVDENDALLGIVHLSLAEVFRYRSQVNGYYPLTGGVGFGRIRISMVWRSVQLQAPPQEIGWDYGTVEINDRIISHDIPGDLKDLKLKWHTNIGSGKMYAQNDGSWTAKKNGRSLFLPVHKRYASCLSLRFKRNAILKDKTAAFAVLWLKDIPDDEEKELTLPVYKGDYDRAVACCLDNPGEKIGGIKVTIAFWAGLGAGHQRWASKDQDLRQVMEVLDTARDNYESKKNAEELGITEGDGDDSDSDSSNSSDEGEDSDENAPAGKPSEGDKKVDGVNRDGKMTLIDQAKEYKKNSKQKHRRHRGLMQYKLPRNAQWAQNKVGRLESKISGIFGRHTREPGIETEV